MRMRPTLTSLRRNQRGNVAIVFSLTAIPVVGLASLAIDYGRALNERAKLQAIVDEAALNGANPNNSTDVARQAAANATLTNNGVPVTPTTSTATNGTVVVEASGSVTTSLAQVIGFTSIPFTAKSSAVAGSGKQLELSMMVDLTGSMGAYVNGQTKIAGLKAAADDLLNILFPNNATTSTSVRVAVAPFADYVNAGGYADEATGLALTGGSYSNIYNLASTRQGRFFGNYTGAIGNTSPAGQTSLSGVLNAAGASAPTSTNSAGGTFSNGYCAVPTVTTNGTVGVQQISNRNGGVRVGRYTTNNGNTFWTGAPPPGMLFVPTNTYISWFNEWWTGGWKYYNGNWDDVPQARDNTYYVPLVSNTTGLTVQTRTAPVSGVSRTGPIGVAIWSDGSSGGDARIQRNNSTGFWHVAGVNTDGSLSYSWQSAQTSSSQQTSWYIPLYTSLNISQTSTVAGCESPVVAQPSSKLITCVTERTGPNAYTDAGPGTAYVGAYSGGSNSVQNYSSDGKCWVAGRELPSIIPLTNDKATLTSFFNSATVGGATPGHIGTAWAWYMISPNWSSVFTGPSMPTAYNQPNVMKAAILMTDGEYNIHYASATARDQALALCANMKAQGIKVFTVGFGFSTSATANASGTTEQRAKDLLQQCASDSSSYFFPYDGNALRAAFSQIGTQLMGETTVRSSKITN